MEMKMTVAPSNRWLVLTAVILAFLPVVVDMTILHIAVPSLTAALGASGTEILWIIDIYPLIMAGLLVPMGTLGDRAGHRRLMLTGLTIFGTASVCAAFSTTAMMLILSRAFLALGSSMIMPSVLAIVRQTFEDPKERAVALGVWTTVGSAGAAIGPLVGGFLLEHFWWGSVFLINVPIMLVVLPVVFVLVPNRPVAAQGSWKIGHAMLLIAGLIATVYAIKSGFKAAELSVWNLAVLVAGLGLIGWFARLQVVSSQPLLDLSLFRKPAISVGMMIAFVVSGSFAGFELLLAQELQYVYGRTPLQAGLFMMPLVVASAIAGPIAGKLAGRFSLRWLGTIGLGAAALSLFGISQSDIGGDVVIIGGLLAVLGFALGVGLLASSAAIMGAAPVEKAGAAGSLEATGYELGAGLGITFFGVLLSSIYRTNFTGVTGPGIDLEAASGSIGEAMVIARRIGGTEGEAIAEAARVAFASAHGSVLMVTASLIAMLAIVVFVALRHEDAPLGTGAVATEP
jgi:DHA2 family multidrug resistance protein-like MFS transporter